MVSTMSIIVSLIIGYGIGLTSKGITVNQINARSNKGWIDTGKKQ